MKYAGKQTTTRKVNAIIERAGDGTYSIYSDADDLGYLVTGTGETVEEAKRAFEGSYSDIRLSYERHGEPFTEAEMTYQYDVASFLAYSKRDDAQRTEEEFFARVDHSLQQAREGRVTRIETKEELTRFLEGL